MTLRGRREASERLQPLWCPECRSTYADPWSHTCGIHASAPRDLDAWEDTLATLSHLGLTPMVPAEVARCIWRRGGRSLRLISRVSEHGGIQPTA